MKNLGVEECLCRYLDTDNEIITLIEFNQYRQKSTSDILNESRILEREYKNLVGWKKCELSKQIQIKR